MNLTLPTDSAARKRYPLARGPLAYAPAALAGVARVCIDGNDKHNPGEPLHHARGKSTDHADCIVRHLVDVQDLVAHIERTDGNGEDIEIFRTLLTEVDQLAWRALMFSQELHEKYGGAPLAPGARLPVPAHIVCAPAPPVVAAVPSGTDSDEQAMRGCDPEPIDATADRTAWPLVTHSNAETLPRVWRGVCTGRWFVTVVYGVYDPLPNSYDTVEDARAAYWLWKDSQG